MNQRICCILHCIIKHNRQTRTCGTNVHICARNRVTCRRAVPIYILGLIYNIDCVAPLSRNKSAIGKRCFFTFEARSEVLCINSILKYIGTYLQHSTLENIYSIICSFMLRGGTARRRVLRFLCSNHRSATRDCVLCLERALSLSLSKT